MSDHSVFIKIGLLWYSVPECYGAIHSMANSIYNPTFRQIRSSIRINHDTTVYCAIDFIRYWFAINYGNVHNLSHVGIMTEIRRNPSIQARIVIAPARFIFNEFQNPGITFCIIVII